MKIEQESKFDAVDGRLVNRATGAPIPDDEPVFVLRAKDYRAVQALLHYERLCKNPEHQRAVITRIAQFKQFASDHPERMKEPDTAP